MAFAELTTYVRSGSRASVSGVGTQMRIASGSFSRAKLSVASNPVLRISATVASGICLMNDFPAFSFSTLCASMSKPRTRNPAATKARASGNPT